MSDDVNLVDKPLVPPEVRLQEITVKGLILGAILSMALAAANAYIGLLVGLTVSASIPAAAVSMGVLRLFKRSNILENNLVQTAASAGESLVAGIIFTIPALVIMGAWGGYAYGPMLAIAVVGGIMGVAFTVPLRRALIVEAKLRYPEGVATAEVLKTGGIETHEHHTERSEEATLGFRMLLKYPGLTAVAGVAIAFAIMLGAGAFEFFSDLLYPRMPFDEGDRMSFTHRPGTGVEVSVNGSSKGVLEGDAVARALWAIWLGPEPPNEGLKTGMLGLGS